MSGATSLQIMRRTKEAIAAVGALRAELLDLLEVERAAVALLVESLSDVLGAVSEDPDFDEIYDRAEVLVETYRKVPPAKKTRKAKKAKARR